MKPLMYAAGVGLLLTILLSIYKVPTPTLRVGDPAPKLEAVKWLKGAAVSEFRTGEIYVVDFWATWCGPCMETMPHLNALAEKYRDSVKMIAVSVDKGESAVSLVQQFVDKQQGRMAVALDDPQRNLVYETWMSAAGQRSIPMSFIVDRAGKISWIGHPANLEKFLVRAIEAPAGTI